MIQFKKRKYENLFLFIFMFLYIFFLHIIMTQPQQLDDIWFKAVVDDPNMTFFKYWLWRYDTWSSRLIIETVLIIMTNLPHWVWCFSDSLIVMLLSYSVLRLVFGKERNKYYILIIFPLLLLYPATEMSSAGWVATTMNYLWPLSLGLYSLIPLKNEFTKEKNSKFLQITSILCLIYIIGAEQMTAILFGLYCILGGYIYYKSHRCSNIIILNFLIIIFSLFFMLFCPGNEVRSITDLHWFPGYEFLTLFDKVRLGFLSSTLYFIEKKNLIYFVFVVFLAFGVLKKYTSFKYRLIGFLPLFIYIAVLSLTKLVLFKFPELGIFHENQPLMQIQAMGETAQLIYIIFNSIIIGIILLNIFFLFDTKKEAFLSIIILLAGLASRIIMGFSPTLFVSSERTFIYMYVSIIVVILFIDKSYVEKKYFNKKEQISIISFLWLLVCIKYILYNVKINF